MKRVLVTGGSGRLGKYVVAALGNDFQVTVFDRNAPVLDCAFIQGNILDRCAVEEAVRNQDGVIHLAALDADVAASDSEFINVNVEGTCTGASSGETTCQWCAKALCWSTSRDGGRPTIHRWQRPARHSRRRRTWPLKQRQGRLSC